MVPHGVDVDPVAVDRAISGQPTRMNRLERSAAIDQLTARGYSGWKIARTLGCTGETVYRRWRKQGIWKRADRVVSNRSD